MPSCNPGMLLVLLESGLGLTSCDAQGRNALHMAAAAGHTLTALTLLRRGCSVAAQDHDGTSAVLATPAGQGPLTPPYTAILSLHPEHPLRPRTSPYSLRCALPCWRGTRQRLSHCCAPRHPTTRSG